MRLSSKGEYATRALLELSLIEGLQALSVHELSDRTRISPKYLEQIMMRMRSANIVRSRRGANGGYELARPPGQITIGEVVRLMDGPLAPSLCASESAHVPCPAYRCPSEASCVLRGLWSDVRDAIASVVDGTTLGQLAERHKGAKRVEAYAI